MQISFAVHKIIPEMLACLEELNSLILAGSRVCRQEWGLDGSHEIPSLSPTPRMIGARALLHNPIANRFKVTHLPVQPVDLFNLSVNLECWYTTRSVSSQFPNGLPNLSRPGQKFSSFWIHFNNFLCNTLNNEPTMLHFIIASILMANYLDTDLGKFMQYLK